jgi:HD-like signal output (HDOD) protein
MAFPFSSSSPRPPTLEEVCARALQLPCSPALLPRLIAVLMEPDSSADEIAEIIKVDTSLAASTLRLANSAYFSGGEPAETIADAVVRLGQRELFRLAALALVSRWESSSAGGEPGDHCRHALCTALAAEVLAETSERVDPQTAYTAGLICDLGRLALVHACSNHFPAVRNYCATRGGTWAAAEREILGYTHAEVGARLLEAWSFHPGLAVAAEFCERPADGPSDAQPLLAHLHAAKYVAASFGPGVPESGCLFELNAPLLAEWGFTPELLQETMTIVFERARLRLGEKLAHGPIGM